MATFTGKFKSRIVEKDGLRFLDITEDYDAYHTGNGGRASNAVREFMATHDDTNSYIFDDADISDLYGLVLEWGDGSINFAKLIEIAIYAGMCASEWATPPESEVSNGN